MPGAHRHSPEPGCMEDTGAPAWEGAPPRTVSDPRMGKHRHRETGQTGKADGSAGSQVLRPREGPATHVGRREEDLAGSSGGPITWNRHPL